MISDPGQLLELMRASGCLTWLTSYALDCGEIVYSVKESTVLSLLESGLIFAVCDNGTPVKQFFLGHRGS